MWGDAVRRPDTYIMLEFFNRYAVQESLDLYALSWLFKRSISACSISRSSSCFFLRTLRWLEPILACSEPSTLPDLPGGGGGAEDDGELLARCPALAGGGADCFLATPQLTGITELNPPLGPS